MSCWCVNCVSVWDSHRYGTTFVPTEEKAAITPDSKRMEDVLFGTTRKRWEHTHTHLHDIKIWTICILIVFHFSCCQKLRNIWNAPLLSVNLTSKYLWMNLMAKWLMGSAGLQWVSVSLGCPVCVLAFIVSVIYLGIYFLSHTPGGLYKGHVDILAPTVQELANLEREAQTSFLQLCYLPNQLFKAF